MDTCSFPWNVKHESSSRISNKIIFHSWEIKFIWLIFFRALTLGRLITSVTWAPGSKSEFREKRFHYRLCFKSWIGLLHHVRIAPWSKSEIPLIFITKLAPCHWEYTIHMCFGWFKMYIWVQKFQCMSNIWSPVYTKHSFLCTIHSYIFIER